MQILFPVRAILRKIFMNGACMQKNQDRSPSKISSEKQIFCADFISGSHDFTQDLTSGVLILIHSADALVLVMACVDFACASAAKNPFEPP